MPGRAFADSNVLVYAYTNSDLQKQSLARDLLKDQSCIISTQVLLETTNVLVRKNRLSYADAGHLLAGQLDRALISTTPELVQESWRISERYRFSIFDSAIVAAAISARCKILYTEDLQHDQRIEGVRIVNPFLPK